jgi:hypothetical protein
LRSDSKTLYAPAGRKARTSVLANHIAASLGGVSGRPPFEASATDNGLLRCLRQTAVCLGVFRRRFAGASLTDARLDGVSPTPIWAESHHRFDRELAGAAKVLRQTLTTPDRTPNARASETLARVTLGPPWPDSAHAVRQPQPGAGGVLTGAPGFFTFSVCGRKVFAISVRCGD